MEESKFNVSVIVPVYNNKRGITKFLKSLLNQNYNKDLFEIIIVDNGSTDGTVENIKQFDVTLLLEHNKLRSPYSARNRGIEKASGNIIALLDSTCIPKENWLSEGVRCFHKEKADIVGGNIIFRYDGKKTAAKMFDAITNVKMKQSIEERKIAKTGNLFIRREVFNIIGLFPEGIRSGGDVRWTRKASSAGFKIVFCKDASVNYPAKPLRKLIKKQWRVGLGQPGIWLEEGEKNNNFILVLKRLLNRLLFLHIIQQKKEVQPLKEILVAKEMKKYRLRVLLIGFFINIIMITANCIGMLNLKSNSEKKKND